MRKLILNLIIYLTSIVVAVVWTFEHPDKIESIKGKLKKQKKITYEVDEKASEEKFIIEANAYSVKVKKIITLKEKTAFVLKSLETKKLNANNISIYLQDGYKITNLNLLNAKSNQPTIKKLKLNKNFTLEFNGGIKTVFFYQKNIFALVSSLKDNCYYASIVKLNTGKEIFNTSCLPTLEEDAVIDFNGLGSSHVDLGNSILISIGTPTTNSHKINLLAQNKSSFFGKILKIKKNNLEQKKIKPEIFSLGHRNPQGVTLLENKIFSVEHGPKGGDELNLVEFNKNYGWPLASYGTQYLYDNDGKSYSMDHKILGFEPPIYSFIPSVGINSLNNCPLVLKNYYKKNCLLATSIHGNNLRPGKSLLIFLLDNEFKKVQSVEKILLNQNMPLRTFVTNEKNEIFEDKNGSIFVSSDNNGIYKITFENFR